MKWSNKLGLVSWLCAATLTTASCTSESADSAYTSITCPTEDLLTTLAAQKAPGTVRGIGDITCEGDWVVAAISVEDGSLDPETGAPTTNDYPQIFRYVNGRWTAVDRDVCAGVDVPDLVAQRCNAS